MANDINPEYVVTGLNKTFASNDVVVPNNVGYYSIDTREIRIGNGTDKWGDLVPFIYNEESIKIIKDWDLSEDDNVPNSLIVKDRFEILERVSGDHELKIKDHENRIKALENDHTPIVHTFKDNSTIKYGISTKTDYGHSKLSDSITSTTLDIAKGTAATPKAVATVNTTATEALDIANAAMPIAGGTFTGHVNNNSYYTCTGTNPYYRTVTTGITRGVVPNTDTNKTTSLRIVDSGGNILSSFRNVYYKNLSNRTDILAYTGLNTDDTASRISIGYDSSGNVYTYAPTPATTSTPDDNIATTKFVSEYVSHNQNPIGTIIMYWGMSAPKGYLICDGSAINETKYPELAKICGTNVPDLRHRFIRGASSVASSAAGTYVVRKTGMAETDTGRNVTGTYDAYELSRWSAGCTATGAFFGTSGGYRGTSGHDGSSIKINFDASRVWGSTHTANEFRPTNVAVLFCIKHD